MPDAIHAAHRPSNHLPRQHAGQVLRDPWADEDVTIDNALVPLIEAMWSAGIRTVASCQNVAEFAYGAVPDLVPAMLAGRSALDHVDTIARGLAYVRVTDSCATRAALRRMVGELSSVKEGGGLLQLEFSPESASTLPAHIRSGQPAMSDSGAGASRPHTEVSDPTLGYGEESERDTRRAATTEGRDAKWTSTPLRL